MDNFKINVESQLRKSPNILFSSMRGMLKGLNIHGKKLSEDFNFVFLVGTQPASGLNHTLRELSKEVTRKYLKKLKKNNPKL